MKTVTTTFGPYKMGDNGMEREYKNFLKTGSKKIYQTLDKRGWIYLVLDGQDIDILLDTARIATVKGLSLDSFITAMNVYSVIAGTMLSYKS